MRTLTCIHHPKLRWLCKNEGVNKDGSYNGNRNIHFMGEVDPTIGYTRLTKEGIVDECDCPPSDLRFASEDKPY